MLHLVSTKRRFVRASLGDSFSEGSRLLWLAFMKVDATQEEFASHIIDSDGRAMPGEYLSKLLYGVRRPGRQWSGALASKHKIPLGAWDEEPHEAFSPPGAGVSSLKRRPKNRAA